MQRAALAAHVSPRTRPLCHRAEGLFLFVAQEAYARWHLRGWDTGLLPIRHPWFSEAETIPMPLLLLEGHRRHAQISLQVLVKTQTGRGLAE